MNTELTIVIPAKNEEKTIANLLRSLASQTYHVYDCKIILADAGSTDKTVDTARLLASRLNLLQFEVIPGGLPAVGRNAGAKASNLPATKSRFVLFIDADIRLASYTLIERCIQEMRAKGLHCVTTDILCPQGEWKSKLAYKISNFYQRGSRFFGTPFATGMFMMFDRKVFDELGGFNEGALFAEDYMLSKLVKWNRFRVIPGGVETSDRRFQKMGYWKLAKLFFGTALLSHRSNQFLKDHGYWNS
jgi:glycosyltransferase involved in cell wall biosynthesis